jgi:F0F1-type ATP synthase membrane subunit b/b'
MDAMLHALGGILLHAIPTFLLVVALHFYLKSVFFKPLGDVLKKRYEATEGARKQAKQSLEAAAAKTAQYEQSLAAAKQHVYQAQEKSYRGMQDRESAAIAEARAKADASIKAAKAEIAAEAAEAKTNLAPQSDILASQIAEAILGRGAAA